MTQAKELVMRKIRETMALIRRNGGNGHTVSAPPPLWESASEEHRQTAGWISPAYVQSRTVKLDPLVLGRNRCLLSPDTTREAESFRILRRRVLQLAKSSGENAIMITSALPGEGKTVTAINLAFAISREFQHTVLLVDGDLKKQSIQTYLGYTGEKGLVDHLVGGTPVPELITWTGIEKMTVISGGRLVNESDEILGSPRMRELMEEMKGRYSERFIILDAPPVLTGADVLTLAPLVDKIIVVVQAGKTSMDDVQKALGYLPQDKVLGLVLNRGSSPHPSSYYHDRDQQKQQEGHVMEQRKAGPWRQ